MIQNVRRLLMREYFLRQMQEQLSKLWTFKTGGIIAASAAVVEGTVYVGSWDGYEYALDQMTGTLKWKTFLGITIPAS